MPEALVCGRATEVLIVLSNPTQRDLYSVVVEFEPNAAVRLDGGAGRIEVEQLAPGVPHEHQVTLTGRRPGAGRIDVPYVSYLTESGTPVTSRSDPLMVRVEPGRALAPAPVEPSPGSAREPPPVPSVFVCHRHAESGWLGQLIRARLAALLTGSRVFVDHDDLGPGEIWRMVLDRELERAAALLALIGPDWEAVTDDAGVRRLFSSDDVVRHEIATALQRRILLIPVLHGRTALPRPGDLPAELQGLTEHHAIHLDHRTLASAIRRIAVQLRGAGLR